jgi:dTDP-4-amino-4,6-dideoxygalactose transaminase
LAQAMTGGSHAPDQAAMADQTVPLLDLRGQYAPLRDRIREVIDRVCDDQLFILGPEVAALEDEVATVFGVRHGIGVSSGTDALLVSLMAAGVGPGDEVVTTAYSFFATAGVIVRLGATPVFVDVDPDSLNIDPVAATAAIGDRTRAIVPVHLFGRSAALQPFLEDARQRGIVVVEDAAQSLGTREPDGTPARLRGDYGCISFFPTKNLGAFGDAGMVVTDDEDLARLVRQLRMHGEHRKYYHERVGGNFRMDALQAAILRVKLPHLDAWVDGRRRNAARYRDLFAEAGLSGLATLPEDAPGHSYNQFVIRVDRRDELQSFLTDRGVGTAIYYPVPLHLQECFAHLGYAEGDLPISEAVAKDSLAIPIYPELDERQQAYVVARIVEFFRGR